MCTAGHGSGLPDDSLRMDRLAGGVNGGLGFSGITIFLVQIELYCSNISWTLFRSTMFPSYSLGYHCDASFFAVAVLVHERMKKNREDRRVATGIRKILERVDLEIHVDGGFYVVIDIIFGALGFRPLARNAF